MSTTTEDRVAVIATLANKVGPRQLGRTSLMKLLYFLEEVKGVPLGYNFTLYSYGPYDSQVLSDLGAAERRQAVVATVVTHRGGYGYQISPGAVAPEYIAQADAFLTQYGAEIDWVAENFGNDTPADLELLSTIVYAHREPQVDQTEHVLVAAVHGVKPKFAPAFIAESVHRLKNLQIIEITP